MNFKFLIKYMASRNLILLINCSSANYLRQEEIFPDLANSVASTN